MSTIAVIAGGHRPQGQTPRIAKHIAGRLGQRGHSVNIIDLTTLDLPFWDEGMWGVQPLAEKWQTLWQPIAKQLEAAEGFVVVSPEYHGIVPAKLINFFLLCGNGPLLAHKPALAVTDSVGPGGSYPMTELKGFTSKNNRMAYLPEHLIVRNNADMFVENPKPEHADANAYMEKRLDWCLTLLEDYIKGFNQIRAAGHTMNPDYPNGM